MIQSHISIGGSGNATSYIELPALCSRFVTFARAAFSRSITAVRADSVNMATTAGYPANSPSINLVDWPTYPGRELTGWDPTIAEIEREFVVGVELMDYVQYRVAAVGDWYFEIYFGDYRWRNTP
jgi:hypothetical protein